MILHKVWLLTTINPKATNTLNEVLIYLNIRQTLNETKMIKKNCIKLLLHKKIINRQLKFEINSSKSHCILYPCNIVYGIPCKLLKEPNISFISNNLIK